MFSTIEAKCNLPNTYNIEPVVKDTNVHNTRIVVALSSNEISFLSSISCITGIISGVLSKLIVQIAEGNELKNNPKIWIINTPIKQWSIAHGSNLCFIIILLYIYTLSSPGNITFAMPTTSNNTNKELLTYIYIYIF